eukprot:CAMPEP_0113960114 /NCGR_PEP_ID=MMETSP0011_2-20120614/4528_1 /TAXON_ID=101924 /ORGANISM="Rhodosorus marinus" /LENGTH=770 /DNA_ID=CAMNT_0000971517 /DNA_START=261 /DNA_END=2573 /DNA_ORIENTATION=- /assembly_acc=CAM_ASM_000156
MAVSVRGVATIPSGSRVAAVGGAFRSQDSRGKTLWGNTVHSHSGSCRCCSSTSSSSNGDGVKASTGYNEMAESAKPGADEIYTSRHFELQPGEVHDLLRRHDIEFRDSSDGISVKNCPFCHPINNKRENQWKLSINTAKGIFMCHRCSAKGGWWTLRNKLYSLGNNETASQGNGGFSMGIEINPLGGSYQRRGESAKITAEEQEKWVNVLSESAGLQHYMQQVRGLKPEVLETYGVGGVNFPFMTDGRRIQKLCFTFPMIDESGSIVRAKIRSMEDKSSQLLYPKGGKWGLFGLHTVPESAKEIILTEGEFDAMAAYQATGVPAVSLPNGANSLPVELLPSLERFEKIYLWMDDDHVGREGAQAFVKKLGIRRCYLVKTRGGTDVGPKDANDALREGVDMKALLEKAGPAPNHAIVQFRDMILEIYDEVKNPKRVAGLQFDSLKGLNNTLKGHRRGELTVVSGHTGVGKTTLMGQMSLDLCMKGVRTLWGSFEINNVRLAKTLLGQFYYMKTGRYLRPTDIDSLETFEELCAEFENLPLYFMKFYGSCPVPKVIETMEYANYLLDTTHFVLDNLQFMLSGQARGTRKFDLQDEAIIEFRKFATSNNAHISLVMHPRKEQDDELLTTSSISGTAKATQEADNILLVQRGERHPFLDIRKNRYDGGVGSLPLAFDPESKVFNELPSSALEQNSLMKFNGREFPNPRRGQFTKAGAFPKNQSFFAATEQMPNSERKANQQLSNLFDFTETPSSIGRAAQARKKDGDEKPPVSK